MQLLFILYSIYIILYSLYYYVILFCCLLSLLDICGLTVVSTFPRATLYTGPRIISPARLPPVCVLQRVQYWSKARRKSLVKPLFLACNVMCIMLRAWSRAHPVYFPQKGMGEARAQPPRVPSQNFSLFHKPLLLFIQKYAKIEKRRHRTTKQMFYDRKHKGWDIERILTTPKITKIGGYRKKGVFLRNE